MASISRSVNCVLTLGSITNAGPGSNCTNRSVPATAGSGWAAEARLGISKVPTRIRIAGRTTHRRHRVVLRFMLDLARMGDSGSRIHNTGAVERQIHRARAIIPRNTDELSCAGSGAIDSSTALQGSQSRGSHIRSDVPAAP